MSSATECRLALGTAQFGLAYGVANRRGQVPESELAAILARGAEVGLDTLDTAIGYGDSEARLGRVGVSGWRIVSKLPEIPPSCTDVGGFVFDAVRGSLDRLRVSRLHGLLLHRPMELLGANGDRLYEGVAALKSEGIVGQVGLSIYGPQQLEVLYPRYDIDMIQAPFNVFDRRLRSSGWLGRLREGGVEVHTRSAFLQGLLLMAPESRPAYFDRWAALWQEWDNWLGSSGTPALDACLAFALSESGIARVVVGVDSLAQLEEILASASASVPILPSQFAVDDAELVDPTHWRLT